MRYQTDKMDFGEPADPNNFKDMCPSPEYCAQ